MKIKFAVIGVNPLLRANFVFSSFPREKGELAAVCDHDPEMFGLFEKAYPEFAGVKRYSDYRDLLSNPEIQAVFVVVRDHYHEEIATALLEAGATVIAETPAELGDMIIGDRTGTGK